MTTKIDETFSWKLIQWELLHTSRETCRPCLACLCDYILIYPHIVCSRPKSEPKNLLTDMRGMELKFKVNADASSKKLDKLAK